MNCKHVGAVFLLTGLLGVANAAQSQELNSKFESGTVCEIFTEKPWLPTDPWRTALQFGQSVADCVEKADAVVKSICRESRLDNFHKAKTVRQELRYNQIDDLGGQQYFIFPLDIQTREAKCPKRKKKFGKYDLKELLLKKGFEPKPTQR